MNILGISGFYHDSAAALVQNGKIVAASQEERFRRIKHFADFPTMSVEYCLREASLSLKDIDFIAFYDKPFLKFERLLETYLAFAPYGFHTFRKSFPLWIKDKLFQKKKIVDCLKSIDASACTSDKIRFVEHHNSHAASAFFPSPFSRAAILTLDGVGEWSTTSIFLGRGNDLSVLKEIHFPHSIGLLYSAFTYFTGFKVNSGEYKLMGLAPYGKPRFFNRIMDNLIDVKEDGSFRLNMTYFDFCTGLKMTNQNFNRLFEGIPRDPDKRNISQKDMDLAASVQKVVEEVIFKIASHIAVETGEKYLCLAGGVALNCVANGKLLKKNIFKDIWIQPAAGDAGGAIGASYAVYHQMCGKKRTDDLGDLMQGCYLGPQYSEEEVISYLEMKNAIFHNLSEEQMYQRVVQDLKIEKAVGWFQGRMEFGPRALGNRSILGDPRSKSMQSVLNLKVKFRESFRPFAPSVLKERASEWFDIDTNSPYMMLVDSVKSNKLLDLSDSNKKVKGLKNINIPRSLIPAVTHIDNSARIHTVDEYVNKKFYTLIKKFESETDCPILINTSFNVRGEPIVCSPEDAYRCFMGTNIDSLVVGNLYLAKEEQPDNNVSVYRDRFTLD